MAWRGKRGPDKTIDKPYFYHPELFTDEQKEMMGALAVQANIEFQEVSRPAVNRLLFARYLVDLGIISEGIQGNGVDLVEGYEPEITIGGAE
jgi:hypothetical protein